MFNRIAHIRFLIFQILFSGIALSLFAGVFYGTTFVPVIYIQQHGYMVGL